ncbi:hypothetical protein [Actinoallomurus iriomotensis]|nr:hypothetical protein [Actinoallomurus iriomotensis]
MAVAQPAYARQIVYVPCNTAALIAAVNGLDTIGSGTLRLASNCDYALTAPSATGRGPDGLLVTGDISIIGGSSTRITRSATAAAFRVLEVGSGARLYLRNVFISGGLTDNTVPANDSGGGILNSRGTIVLSRTTVSGNTADNGAGISNDSGRLITSYTLIQNNSTRTGGGGGGGVYNDGAIMASNSIIRGNRANTNGGGLYNGQGGRAETYRTTIDHNTAGASGGGLYNTADARLLLRSTLVQLNSATNGGGIFNGGIPSRVSLNNSLIQHNTPNNCVPLGSLFGCTN